MGGFLSGSFWLGGDSKVICWDKLELEFKIDLWQEQKEY